jgi:hypothetical protein
LLLCADSNDVLTDGQFGFKPGYATVDAIFALYSLVSNSLSNKNKLYCAFIDFHKAFDSIDRIKLWFKLSKLGSRGTILNMLKSLYSNVKSCVTVNGFTSEYVANTIGLMQGEVLSPILFSMYVNDFEMSFINADCIPYDCQSLNLFLLMYADDLVLFSETADGLQYQLDALFQYANDWSLTVNTSKSKVVIFRNGGVVSPSLSWHIGGIQLEIVDKFNYLGVLLNYNNKFFVAEKQFADQGRKATFALAKNTRGLYLNPETQLSLFDCYVGSILNYASEVIGLCSSVHVEKVHLDFCKRLLGVKKSTCNAAIYTELGRYPLKLVRTFNMIKYWCKLLSTGNCILRGCYDQLLENAELKGHKNWVYHVKVELCKLGFHDLWFSQSVSKTFLPVIRQRLCDQELQGIVGKISVSSKCKYYMYLTDSFYMQFYLRKPIPKLYQKFIAKYRLPSHSL